jgi:hypothetical protein
MFLSQRDRLKLRLISLLNRFSEPISDDLDDDPVDAGHARVIEGTWDDLGDLGGIPSAEPWPATLDDLDRDRERVTIAVCKASGLSRSEWKELQGKPAGEPYLEMAIATLVPAEAGSHQHAQDPSAPAPSAPPADEAEPSATGAAGRQQEGLPADGTVKDAQIWLKGKPYRLTPGLRALLSYLLDNPNVSESRVIKHCGMSGSSHLHKRLKDLRDRLNVELKKSRWRLRIKTEATRISCKWEEAK